MKTTKTKTNKKHLDKIVLSCYHISMMDYTAKDILDIPVDFPEELFSNSHEIAKKEFRKLGMKWHPDHNSDTDSTNVFQHIQALYDNAKKIIGTPSWKKDSVLSIRINDKVRTVPYFKQIPFELGEMYVGRTDVLYSIRKEHKELYDNAGKFLSKFEFAGARMQDEMEKYLPKNVEYFSSPERLFMLIPKTEDVILLSDVVSHFSGKLEPRHVAWIISSAHNIACYLSYAKIVHGNISPISYFISPKHHSGLLLGGWWYATKKGEKLAILPSRSASLAPPDIIRKKISDIRLDLELVRAMGRELLGDLSGVNLKKDSLIPEPLAKWLNGVTTGDAVLDYKLWKDILRESFGDPKFIDFKIDADTIYKVRKRS